jgi:hypothetical protein
MGDVQPEQILMRMSWPDREGPYVLGCFGKTVTFYSQQRRALNLIWALFREQLLRQDDSLAVVGGGLAGLTAAAAAASKGCHVTLFERNDEILHVQRTNGSRYVHPHLNSWPDVSPEKIATDLPFLNWYPGRTSEVCKQIEDEWRLFERVEGEEAGPVKRVLVRRQHEVTDIRKTAGGFLVCGQKRHGGGFNQEIFSRVILAVGFGLERSMTPIPFHSYWEDDSLHQGMTIPGREMHFFVSGTGDGGLIDTLRICLKDFDQGRFLRSLAFHEGVQRVVPRLREIEEESRRIESMDAATLQFFEYQKLDFGQEFDDWLTGQLRPGVKVTLRGRSVNPLGLGSALINRLAIFHLIRLNKIHYLRGEVSATATSDYRWKVAVNNGERGQDNRREIRDS